jgi:divalent metal cation (Fe/Co/Zn/Cd) transporter
MTTYDKASGAHWVSIAAYLILSAFKLVSGYLMSSSALLADGFNNLTDIVASAGCAHWSAHLAEAAGCRSCLWAFPGRDGRRAAGFLYYGDGRHSGDSGSGSLLVRRGEATPQLWSAGVALICAVAMMGVYIYNKRLRHGLTTMR